MSNSLNTGEEVDKAVLDELSNIFMNVRRKCKNVILSDENILGSRLIPTKTLYPLCKKRIDAYKQIFPNEDIKVILYIRNQDTFIESCFVQDIHQRKIIPFQQYLSSIDMKSLYWSTVVSNICNVVGKENIVVRQFETIYEGFNSFAGDFFSLFCNEQLLKKIKIKQIQRNPSFSKLAIDIATAVGPLVNKGQWIPARKMLQKNFCSKNYPRKKLLDDETRAELTALYEDDNKKLLDDFKNWG